MVDSEDRSGMMKHKNELNTVLKKSSKDSLLLVSRFAFPLGYALILPLMILYVTSLFHSGIETPPFPAVILMPVALLFSLICLMLCHRAVRRELRNRQDEPSDFWKTLRKTLLFSIAGTLVWLALFYATLFVLSKTTIVPAEDDLENSAKLSILLIVICGFVFARKDIASLRDSAKNPDPDPDS